MRASVAKGEIQAAHHKIEEASSSLLRLDPHNVRVVALVITRTGRVVQYDCYDPDGNEADVSNVMQLREGMLWLRTIDWASSKSMDAEVHLHWSSTEVAAEEIGRVSVFRWPKKTPLRVYAPTG